MIDVNVDEILAAALELPDRARADLAERLWQSLDASSQQQLGEEWAQEINRRWQEFEAGCAETVDGPQTIERLKQKFAQP